MFRAGPAVPFSLSPEARADYEQIPRGFWLEVERVYINGIAEGAEDISKLLRISTGREVSAALINYHFHMERDRLIAERNDYLERLATAHEAERDQNVANPAYEKYVRQATYLGALLEGVSSQLLFSKDANFTVDDLSKLVSSYSRLVASDPSVGRQKRKESAKAIVEVQKELLDPESTGMDAALQRVLAHTAESRETADDILEELQDLHEENKDE
jgi:hypothetical protein